MNPTDPISLNITGVQQLIGSQLNKTAGALSSQEGVEGDYQDELSLDMSEQELLQLSRDWANKYSTYESKIKVRQQANETYYLGRQKEGTSYAVSDGQPISANLIFEAEETFLPAAMSNNPEPVVWSDNHPDGDELSRRVKTMLQYHSTVLRLRQKLQRGTRKWTVDFLGVWKLGWDDDIQEIMIEVRSAKDFIFDPDGYVDEYGDMVGYVGERIYVPASRLIELFPHERNYIRTVVDGKLGTEVSYTEWWTDEYTFTTFKDRILDKSKNPHYNYPKTSMEVDEYGEPSQNKENGINHFYKAKKPYVFLSVFSLGEHPHDDTGLIEQNIPNQRRVSRRTEQIDYNLSRSNNSIVYSENNFTQETAKQASRAIALGHPVLVPSGGPIEESIHQLPAQGIEAAYFQELEVSKNDLRTSFGTEGLGSQPPEPNQLATNLVMNEQHDSTRIGGGINEKIENVAESIFNYWVQLYCVYYNEPHEASIMGAQKAVEYVQLQSSDLMRKLVISVAPNSMAPKDEMAEQARWGQLYQQGLIGPKKYFIETDDSDPDKTAEDAALWIADKATYIQLNFPDVAQALAQGQQQQAQAQQQQMQAEVQMKQQEMQSKVQAKQQEMQIKGQEATMDIQAKREEMAQRAEEARQKMAIQSQEHGLKLRHQEEAFKANEERKKVETKGEKKKEKKHERPKKESS